MSVSIVMVQVRPGLPLQAPPQALKLPVNGIGNPKVMDLPRTYVTVHVDPQFGASGIETPPVPDPMTVKVNVATAVKVALTFLL